MSPCRSHVCVCVVVFSLSLIVRQTAVIQLRRSVCSLFWQSDCSQIAAFVWSVWQYFCVPGRQAHCLSSLPLPPSSHHLIKEQGRIQCFLITLCLALGPSFNDETSAQGGLDICFIIIILHLISWGCRLFSSQRWLFVFASRGLSLYNASLFFSLSLLLFLDFDSLLSS